MLCLLLLTFFLVEHMTALHHVVVGNPLAETPSTGRSNHVGGCLTALDRRITENLDSLLQEGLHREQCTYGCLEIGRPLRTPSITMEMKEESNRGWKS
jgi:hypothetical protein